METERITLSQRERDRLKVLYEVNQKHLTQVAAAQRLKVTDRHVRRMLLRLRERGDGPLVHGLRGRPSNRRLAARFEQKILARLRQRYADFGPTLAAEHLTQEGFAVSRETLRKWMTKAALWRPRSQRVKAVHVWRERRASFGELVMQDSSPFRWLEDRGPACQLIALIDDATSRIWGRFTERDTTEENLRTLEGGCGATDVLWPITPIKPAFFERPGRSRFLNNCGEIRCARSSGERCTNWGSNGSRPTVRKPKGGSRDCLKLFRIAW
jgi:transposase